MHQDIPAPPASPVRRLVIDHVGHQGDGRVREADGWVSVPFTLAGETAEVSGSGKRLSLEQVVIPSPDRRAPACRHFGTCGGCSIQHMNPAASARFKHDLIARALAAHRLDTEIDPVWVTPAGSRRRATFAARRHEGRIIAGFHARRSHELTDMEECPVLRPALITALQALRPHLGRLLAARGEASLLITETDSGPDLAVTGPGVPAHARSRAEFMRAALSAGFARVSVAGEAALTERSVRIDLGPASLHPPPGGFLQASREAEAEMARIVLAHLQGTGRGLDLFSGCGTFTLRMAADFPVHAAEASAASVEALRSAARMAQGLRPVTAEIRDLFRNPLSPPELSRFDGLVLNPPRAGASAQAAEIARCRIDRIAYVSCDPVTLARDLAVLVTGGYRLVRVCPVDQFLWSAHVEAVALLERP